MVLRENNQLAIFGKKGANVSTCKYDEVNE
jgi:hypothetical protein